MGTPSLGAVAIAVGLMTKPQALPLVVPFAAFYLGRHGLRGSIRAAIVGVVTVGLLWIPFLGADGPANYLHSLAAYSNEFAVLSLRAWNPWWILTDLVGGGQLVADSVPIVGPITFRWLGVAMAAVLELAIFLWVWRRPTASTLAGRCGGRAGRLHRPHHDARALRLPRGRLPRPCLAEPCCRRRVAPGGDHRERQCHRRGPPHGAPGSLLQVGGLVGVVGSLAMTATLVVTMAGLRRASDWGASVRASTRRPARGAARPASAAPEPSPHREPSAHRDEIPAQVLWQPLPHPEVALAGRAVAPGRGDLGNVKPAKVALTVSSSASSKPARLSIVTVSRKSRR